MTVDKAKTVEINVEFARVGEIDTMNEKYQAEINIESKWEISKDTYNPDNDWNPSLYIENALQEPKEKTRYTVVNNNGKNYAVESKNVKGSFWEKLELQKFPFDIQELSITIASRLDLNDVKLVSTENPKVNSKATRNFVEQQKWTLFRMVKMSDRQTEYTPNIKNTLKISPIDIFVDDEEEMPEYPKLVASCYCSRRAGYYLFNAFFLIFLITMTTFTGFAIDSKLPQNRIPATCTFLLTSVSFKWVINRSLPTVSYLTSLDKYSIMCIFYICLLATWHAIIGSFWTKDEAKEVDKWAVIGFACLFALLNILFLIWMFLAYKKIWDLKKMEKKYLEQLKAVQQCNILL